MPGTIDGRSLCDCEGKDQRIAELEAKWEAEAASAASAETAIASLQRDYCSALERAERAERERDEAREALAEIEAVVRASEAAQQTTALQGLREYVLDVIAARGGESDG